MALTRTNIIGRITLPDDTNPVNSVVRFVMTGFDTDDTENATIIQIPIDATIDALGDIDVDLWPNPLGVRSTFYATYVRIPDGNTNDVINVYVGQISVPATGGPYDLNDLLPIAPPAGADVADYIAQLAAAVALTEASATSAAASAAEATLFDGPKFDTIALMSAYTTAADGGFAVVWNGDNGEHEVFEYLAGSVIAADGALVVDATGMGAGRWVSTRREFSSFDEMIVMDSRTFAGGTTLTIPSIGAVYQATAGTGNLGQTNAGGQQFDVVTPLAVAFGPVGDGATNDSAIFQKIEASAFKEIDLGGQSYALVSFWVDVVNGVKLTKSYKNGTLILDGRELVMDRDFGISASAAAALSLPRTSAQKSLGLFKNDDNNFDVWTNKVGQVWTKQSLSRTSTAIPFNLNRGVFTTVLAYKAAREDGVVYTGGWATDNATTALSSAGDTYISGRAQQSITAGDYVEITFNGGGDIYVIFTGRTTGNFVNVLLEGTQNYLTLPDDGGGNSYFDSYTSADLQHRQSVQIASGVPSGTHTIRLTVSASKNASSAGDSFVFNALGWSSADVGPWTPEADAPAWVTGEAVLLNQRRKSGQNYYRATADGTTGATAPTHTSGSVSDGGVTWAYMATSSYESPEHLFQAPGSQLEYAYEIKPTGATSFEDVGGALHGNEAQTAVQWYLSGSKVTPPNNAWLVGENLEIREDLEVTHSEIGGGVTVIDNTTLRRRFVREGFEVSYPRSMQADGVFGYDYPHMWPLLHYEAAGFRKTVLDVWTPSDGHRDPADWYGISNPFVGRTKDTLMVASGNCLQPAGSAGVPSTTPAPYRFVAWLDVSPESVDYYRATGSVHAGKAMNLSGGDFTSGGFSSGSVKMYFERSSTLTPQPFSDGDVIECRAFYGITVMGA